MKQTAQSTNAFISVGMFMLSTVPNSKYRSAMTWQSRETLEIEFTSGARSQGVGGSEVEPKDAYNRSHANSENGKTDAGTRLSAFHITSVSTRWIPGTSKESAVATLSPPKGSMAFWAQI